MLNIKYRISYIINTILYITFLFNRFAHAAGPGREASKLLGVSCTGVAGAFHHIEADSRSHAINAERKLTQQITSGYM